jgi:hypothetical protein
MSSNDDLCSVGLSGLMKLMGRAVFGMVCPINAESSCTLYPVYTLFTLSMSAGLKSFVR